MQSTTQRAVPLDAAAEPGGALFRVTWTPFFRSLLSAHLTTPLPKITPTTLTQEAVLDSIIERLVDARSGRPGRAVALTEAEIRGLCTTARDVLMAQPNLLELEAPIKICGE